MENYDDAGTDRFGDSPEAAWPALVARPRLTTKLDAAPGSVLLTAPAGFGKTTLLHQWTDGSGLPSVWVDGSGPERQGSVWAAILDKLEGTSVLPAEVLHRMSGVGDDPLAAFGQLRTALEETPVRLVFDDIDAFSAAERNRWFPELLNLPAHSVQVIATTRDRAAVDAGQARLSSRLLDVTAGDLTFMPAETARLAARLAPGLAAHTLDRVQRHTGGWPACTVLTLRALHSLAGRPVPPDGLRLLTDYLDRDVFPALTAEERDLLFSICVCREAGAGQAAALSGRTDAGAVLTRLGDRGLVEAAGREQFRIHPVLREYLLERLGRTDPARLHQLHGLAAAWHSRSADPAAALRHATASGEPQRVQDVLAEHGVSLLSAGRGEDIRRAVAKLPEDTAGSDATPFLIAALAHLEVLAPTAAARWMNAAAGSVPAGPGADLAHLQHLAQAGLRWFSPQWLPPPQPPGSPVPDLPPAGPALRIASALLNAAAYAAQGDFPSADLATAEALAEAAGNPHLTGKVLTEQAFNAALRGQMRQAGRDLARIGGGSGSSQHGPGGAGWHLIQALRALLRAEPSSARELAAAALSTLTRFEGAAHGVGATLRSAAAIVDGAARLDLAGGNRVLNEMRLARIQLHPDIPYAGTLGALAAVTEHTAALSLGNTGRAGEVVQWARQRLPESGELCLLRASGAAALSRFPTASERLQPLHEGSAVPVLAWTAIHVSVLECAIALRTGRRTLAVEHLVRALRRADELDVLRPLVTAPADVAGLLAERAGSYGAEEETAERVLSLRPAAPLPQPLTARQQEILSLLPSHLSLGQVAAELQVSVNTVKTHVRIVYAKLGVSSRHDAVVTAYRIGQLP